MSAASSRKLSLRADRELKEAFQLFDKDQDGKVAKEEIEALIGSLDGDAACPHVQVRVIKSHFSTH